MPEHHAGCVSISVFSSASAGPQATPYGRRWALRSRPLQLGRGRASASMSAMPRLLGWQVCHGRVSTIDAPNSGHPQAISCLGQARLVVLSNILRIERSRPCRHRRIAGTGELREFRRGGPLGSWRVAPPPPTAVRGAPQARRIFQLITRVGTRARNVSTEQPARFVLPRPHIEPSRVFLAATNALGKEPSSKTKIRYLNFFAIRKSQFFRTS